MLRVATNPAGHTIVLAGLLNHASRVLRNFEPLLLWPGEAKGWKPCDPATIPVPPHRARGLFDITSRTDDDTSNTRHASSAWGDIVSTLWRVAMVLDSPSLPVEVGTWDILTCRLLLLRASPSFVSESRNDVNIEEWVRRETLTHLLQGEVEAKTS